MGRGADEEPISNSWHDEGEYFQILLCTNQKALGIHFQGDLGGVIVSRSQGFKFLGSGLRF